MKSGCAVIRDALDQSLVTHYRKAIEALYEMNSDHYATIPKEVFEREAGIPMGALFNGGDFPFEEIGTTVRTVAKAGIHAARKATCSMLGRQEDIDLITDEADLVMIATLQECGADSPGLEVKAKNGVYRPLMSPGDVMLVTKGTPYGTYRHAGMTGFTMFVIHRLRRNAQWWDFLPMNLGRSLAHRFLQ